ncbi:transporter substrate-binding domain-containing protein [Streptomyces anulatus]
MTVLPDPGASRAVLVGTSHYQHLEQLPAVSNNLQALAAHLTGPLSLRLPPQHVTVLENPAAAHTVVSEVRRAAAEATDTLILYFAGHGLIDPQDTLSLALPHTESGRVETGLPYDWLRQVLLMDSRAERHVVILDCCYSGLALGRMNAASPGLADHASVEGSFLLAAAAETRTALAPVGDTYTAFTGALLDTLSRGIPGGPMLLDLGAVYRHLRLTLAARGHPVPQARDRNNGAEVALGPNHAVLPDHTAAPDRPARPGQTVRSGGKGNGRRHALIGTACAAALALLATGGYPIWDQQASQDSKPPAYGIEDSSILSRVKNHKGNKITIGVKKDQPGLSELVDPDRKVFKGFEIDLIEYLLEEIGFKGEIVFEPLFSGEREDALKSNDVDLVIASYSATPKREKEVDFSVPYYKTGQSLLMRKSHTKEGEVQTWDENASRDVALVDMKINRIEDLPDGTDSCTVDSTSSEFMEENLEYKEKFDVQEKEASYKDCIKGLLDEGAVGSYEVISTDDVILAGLAYKYGKKKLVRPIRPFNPEEYAVGMKEGDPALKYLLCRAIKESITGKFWEKYYNTHLKKIMLGKPANPPDEPSCEKRPNSPAAG